MRGKNTKGMVGLAVFLMAAAAVAAPTKGDCEQRLLSGYVASELSPDAGGGAHRRDVTGLAIGRLAGVSGEFHRVPVNFGRFSMGARRTKSLPPAPGSMLLSLVGFLCVWVARERGLWLAAISSLVQASRAGLGLFPVLGGLVAAKDRGEDGSCWHGRVPSSKSEWAGHLPNGLERVFCVDGPGQLFTTDSIVSLSSRNLAASEVLRTGSAAEYDQKAVRWSVRTGALVVARYRSRFERRKSAAVCFTGREVFETRRAAFRVEPLGGWISACIAGWAARGPPA